MQLIGMLDSPYVRRTAVALQLLGLRFEHRPLSVFRTFEAFGRINPVVKAPTLVCDDGTVLMDSTLIIEYAQALALAQDASARRLWPAHPTALARALHIAGLALAACEKSVQIVYEHQLRPPEKQHAPWLERVGGQLRAACLELETACRCDPLAARTVDINLAGVTTAVAWHFMMQMVPDAIPSAACPTLAAYSAQVEQLPAFRAAPHGDGAVQQGV